MAKEKLFRSTKPIRGEEPKKGEKDSPKRGKRHIKGWVTWYEFSMRFVYLPPVRAVASTWPLIKESLRSKSKSNG